MGINTREIVTFQDAVTSTATGTEVDGLGSSQIMVLDIATDATTLTVKFEAQGENGNWVAYSCYDTTNTVLATETTLADNQLWQVDLTGITAFRANITVQTGGTGTTIKGKIMS